MIITHARHAEHFLTGAGALLLCCLVPGPDFKELVELIHEVSDHWAQTVRTVVLVGDSLQSFPARLDLLGTPSFLLFVNNREQNRLLGRTTRKDIETMLRATCRNASRNPDTLVPPERRPKAERNDSLKTHAKKGLGSGVAR